MPEKVANIDADLKTNIRKLRVSKEQRARMAKHRCSVCNTIFDTTEYLNSIIIRDGDGVNQRKFKREVLICDTCMEDMSKLSKIELVKKSSKALSGKPSNPPVQKKDESPKKDPNKKNMYW